MRCDRLHERALRAIADLNDDAILPALQQGRAVIDGKPALLLVPRMTLRAMLPQDGHDLMGEIHIPSAQARGEGDEKDGGLHEWRWCNRKQGNIKRNSPAHSQLQPAHARGHGADAHEGE